MEARHEFSNEKEYKKYLRTYFSVSAMQGLLSDRITGRMNLFLTKNDQEQLAEESIMMADELLKQLEEK